MLLSPLVTSWLVALVLGTCSRVLVMYTSSMFLLSERLHRCTSDLIGSRLVSPVCMWCMTLVVSVLIAVCVVGLSSVLLRWVVMIVVLLVVYSVLSVCYLGVLGRASLGSRTVGGST